MKLKKLILIVIISSLVILQFLRPGKNEGEAFGDEDIFHSTAVPEAVKNILVESCFDCHSNFTRHMWYENIQPIGIWTGHHIEEGKEELNFSVFKTYKLKRAKHKYEEIAEMVADDDMPLGSYTFMHSNAKLSDEQKRVLIDWATLNQRELERQIVAQKEKSDENH
jgi:hypothetical protein